MDEFNQKRTLQRQNLPPLIPKHEEEAPVKEKTTWQLFSRIISAPAWDCCLVKCNKKYKDEGVQQAFREKIALCFLIALVSLFVLFFTLFLQDLLCPANLKNSSTTSFDALNTFNVHGQMYSVDTLIPVYNNLVGDALGKRRNGKKSSGLDFSDLFQRKVESKCSNLQSLSTFVQPCTQNNRCVFEEELSAFKKLSRATFDWEDIQNQPNIFVLNGTVIDMGTYVNSKPSLDFTQPLDLTIKSISEQKDTYGKDATRLFFTDDTISVYAPCLVQLFGVGDLDKQSVSCYLSNFLFTFFLVVILLIILIRFLMALFFSWFISFRLSKTPSPSNGMYFPPALHPPPQRPLTGNQLQSHGNTQEVYTALLVTCYSEGREGLKTTLESLALTEFDDGKKLLFVVCDGIVTGEGNEKSTPDLCIDMMELDESWGNPKPYSYIAIADGAKQHNMARVYAGHYVLRNQRVPMITVVKCGNEQERESFERSKVGKPGNRGKRDSQIILMNFFSRVMFNERMTPLDYDLFRKVHYLMGVTPDFFEAVLMVDADTMVMPDSLKRLNNAIINDPMIMGLCGETRIANKRTSWVTWIQVFEYFISHHLGKSFESMFGGVTCLPGCFCMYRLRAPGKSPGEWVPILTRPEIVEDYSQNVVETLHEKNLLLLGEDRFLTTLMLRTFPQRKMMFVPQARCKTVVPDEFKVLLSQRRRWINSTVHNLLELVLVRNLCGTFCFSMQFVIAMELIGTVSLPVAIFMTYVLIIKLIQTPIVDFQSMIPLILLLLVLFLPAILILLATRKFVYVAWMMIYLIALPVWNFALPVYAYWHFDDFSWGETRKVEGAGKDEHGKKEGKFESGKVVLKRWEEYEKGWRKRLMGKGASADTVVDTDLSIGDMSRLSAVSCSVNDLRRESMEQKRDSAESERKLRGPREMPFKPE